MHWIAAGADEHVQMDMLSWVSWTHSHVTVGESRARNGIDWGHQGTAPGRFEPAQDPQALLCSSHANQKQSLETYPSTERG
eukprot:6464768-Amphidinium_carterae.1